MVCGVAEWLISDSLTAVMIILPTKEEMEAVEKFKAECAEWARQEEEREARLRPKRRASLIQDAIILAVLSIGTILYAWLK